MQRAKSALECFLQFRKLLFLRDGCKDVGGSIFEKDELHEARIPIFSFYIDRREASRACKGLKRAEISPAVLALLFVKCLNGFQILLNGSVYLLFNCEVQRGTKPVFIGTEAAYFDARWKLARIDKFPLFRRDKGAECGVRKKREKKEKTNCCWYGRSNFYSDGGRQQG